MLQARGRELAVADNDQLLSPSAPPAPAPPRRVAGVTSQFPV